MSSSSLELSDDIIRDIAYRLNQTGTAIGVRSIIRTISEKGWVIGEKRTKRILRELREVSSSPNIAIVNSGPIDGRDALSQKVLLTYRDIGDKPKLIFALSELLSTPEPVLLGRLYDRDPSQNSWYYEVYCGLPPQIMELKARATESLTSPNEASTQVYDQGLLDRPDRLNVIGNIMETGIPNPGQSTMQHPNRPSNQSFRVLGDVVIVKNGPVQETLDVAIFLTTLVNTLWWYIASGTCPAQTAAQRELERFVVRNF
ncbi:hypothetical protein DFH09DRAFT_1069895 [Mycena vulgaris]|nr:hypothetical protein DFH09DRAFT_1069895 [Mycena vulgaris]